MVFLSLSARLLANIEALNAVESIGNVSKHRRAPVLLFDKSSGSYTVRYVPAVSGESLAHAYQWNVANLAKAYYGDKVPLCKWCTRGEFLKEMSRQFLIDEVKNVLKTQLTDEEKKHEFEKAAVKACIVEDIGGFLSAEEFPVKRTSTFQVGYMVPTLDNISATIIDTQFHVRHAPVVAGAVIPEEKTAEEVEEGKEEKREEKKEGKKEEKKEERPPPPRPQMVYYVEIASALYGVHFNLDLDSIGRTRLVRVENAVPENERKKRINLAVGGLATTFVGGSFGAKRSRFEPIEEIKSILVTVTHPLVFTASPPHSSGYIKLTANRASSFNSLATELEIKNLIKLFAYDAETGEKIQNIEYAGTPEELFTKVAKYVRGLL